MAKNLIIALPLLLAIGCSSSEFSGQSIPKKNVAKVTAPASKGAASASESKGGGADTRTTETSKAERATTTEPATPLAAAKPVAAATPVAPSPVTETAALGPAQVDIPVDVIANILRSSSNAGNQNCVSISVNGAGFLQLQCLQGEGVQGPAESRTLTLRKASSNSFALQNNNGGSFCVTLLEGGTRLIIGLEDGNDNDYNDYLIDIRTTEGARFENASYPSCGNWGIDENSF
jgi:hypothetical protein